MPVSTTWSINKMIHKDSDGGVITVYWSCNAQNDSGDESASAGDKLYLQPDPSDPSYIPYADLTENDVLNWVYDSLVEGEETPAEAKDRVAAELVLKVDAQIARNSTESEGLPWVSEDA